MPFSQKVSLLILRLSMGWLFLYAGVTKVLNPNWSAAGYIKDAKSFPEFFAFLSRPEILPLLNFVNMWGLTLLGVSLILGVGVRLSSILGAALMVLYYLPILDFPYPNEHSYIVDEHIVYAAALLVLGALGAGRAWGLGKRCASLPICQRSAILRWIVG
jgi:thiosulfate dehydrogenase [quinone] large subunit